MIRKEVIRDWPWIAADVGRYGTRWYDAEDAASAKEFAARWIMRVTNRRGRPVPDPSPSLLIALDRLRKVVIRNTRGLFMSLRHMGELPPEWLPGASPGERRYQWGWARLVMWDAGGIANALGRPVRDVVRGAGPDWLGYAERVAIAAGVGDSDEQISPFEMAADAMQDMLFAFESQVLRPAAHRAGIGWYPGSEGRGDQHFSQEAYSSVRTASLRLLMRDKTLVAFAEATGEWHRRTTALGNALGRLSSGAGLSWERAFEPWTCRVGDLTVEIRSLDTAAELLAEGGDGPDADGVQGLSHCVSSYLPHVLDGGSIVASVRATRPDGKVVRLSTLELAIFQGLGDVDLDVAQHHGERNAPPPDEACEAVDAFMCHVGGRQGQEAIIQVMERIHETERPFIGFYDAMIPGNVEAMIDAWGFALARDLRNASPERLLEAAGLLPAKKARRKTGHGR